MPAPTHHQSRQSPSHRRRPLACMHAAPAPLLLATCLASTVAAQPAPAEPTVIVITAKGYASEAAEAPMSLVVLSRDELDRRGALNPGEALRGQPGLAVASDGAQGQNPVIRGLKRESIVLMVDGLRLNSAQPAGAIASFLSLPLAERVEVVKGPASVLYGTGALGGVVNVRLPQARLEPGLAVDASAATTSSDGSARVAAAFNLGGSQQALMLGAAHAAVDDYRAPAGTVPRTGYDSSALIGQARVRLGELQWRAGGQWQRDEDVWYPGSTRPLPNPTLGSTTVRSPEQTRTLLETALEWRPRAGLEAELRVYRQAMQRHIFAFNNLQQRDTSTTRVRFATTGAEARVLAEPHPLHRLSAGVQAWRMAASPERFFASPTPTSPLVRNDPFADGRIEALGAYVQDDIRLHALNLLVGLRHDRIEGSAASTNNGAVTTGLARRDSASSGSLGLVWQATPQLRPFANLSRGFRAGEMRERFEASPRADGFFYQGNPQVRPEQATQLELGLKLAGTAWQGQLSAYRNRISDYITGQVTGAVQGGLPVKATVNLGRVTIEGVELDLAWAWRPGQRLLLKASALRGTNDDLAEPLFQMPADELTLGWDGRLTDTLALDTRLRLVRRQDRVATRFARGTENPTHGFATADIGLGWQISPTHRLRVALRNLADRAYHEHLADGVSGQEIQAPGRSLSLSWQGRF
jgi:hemoglobin/transferrin/lactoferrin receptor protein